MIYIVRICMYYDIFLVLFHGMYWFEYSFEKIIAMFINEKDYLAKTKIYLLQFRLYFTGSGSGIKQFWIQILRALEKTLVKR